MPRGKGSIFIKDKHARILMHIRDDEKYWYPEVFRAVSPELCRTTQWDYLRFMKKKGWINFFEVKRKGTRRKHISITREGKRILLAHRQEKAGIVTDMLDEVVKEQNLWALTVDLDKLRKD